MAPKIHCFVQSTKFWGFLASMARTAPLRLKRPANFCNNAESQVIGNQIYPPTSPNINVSLFTGFLIFESLKIRKKLIEQLTG